MSDRVEQQALGSGDGPIEIVEYDPSWPSAFVAEINRISPLVPGLQIHHIGSTAVPGLAGKPVIDMIALVDDLEATAEALIARCGYQLDPRFNDGLLHRRYLCYPSIAHRTHHLHLVDVGEDMQQCLRFRDRLRNDGRLCAAYAALKRSLAARYGADRAGYTMAKTRFVHDADRCEPAAESQESTTPGLAAVIRAWYEAGDRRELDTVMRVFGPDVVLDLSRVGLGSYTGHAAVREFVADWWGNYDEFENKPEEIIDLDNGVVLAICHQTARPVGISGQVKRSDAYLFLFEADACVHWAAYPDIDEGRAAAERLAKERG